MLDMAHVGLLGVVLLECNEAVCLLAYEASGFSEPILDESVFDEVLGIVEGCLGSGGAVVVLYQALDRDAVCCDDFFHVVAGVDEYHVLLDGVFEPGIRKILAINCHWRGFHQGAVAHRLSVLL